MQEAGLMQRPFFGEGRPAQSSKHQAPNTREAPSSKFQVPSSKRGPRFGAWNLGFLWCLELGFWCFDSGIFLVGHFAFPVGLGANVVVFVIWGTKLHAMFKPADLFDLSQTAHAALFDGCEYAWEALRKLKDYLRGNLRPGLLNKCEGTAWIGDQVFVGEGTVVEDGAMLKGPAIIGRNCQIRHNAYLREDVIVGDNCVVGNCCEFKHSLLFNNAVVPHFAYVGDSILGHEAHLGAGVKVSNIKLVAGNVLVEI